MVDRAPNARVGRLVARVRVGRTGAEDAARRYVSSNVIDSDAGQTFADLVNHRAVTLPLADGCANLYVDGPDGALPTETMRYSPDDNTGVAVETKLHFDGAGRADGSIVDGGTVVPWLASGKATFAQAMTDQGRWWGIYHGKLRQPAFQPTSSSPHNWPADVSRASMNSLTNWRAWYEWALAGGMAWDGSDADAPSLATDPDKYWQDMLETPGTYDGTALGVPGYTGSFTNGQARLHYVEAVPRIGTYAHSFIALADTFDLRDGDPDWLQAEDCVHPPMVLCTQDAPAADYARALAYVTTREDILVVVNYDELYDAGMDMAALVVAGLSEVESGGGGGYGGVDWTTPVGRPRGRGRARGRMGLEATGLGK